MANNCLITKLKGYVQNSNLPRIGSMTVIIPKYIPSDIVSVTAIGNTARLISKSDGTVYDIGNGYSFSNENLTEDTEFWFESKYDALISTGSTTLMNNVEFNIEEFKYISPDKLTMLHWWRSNAYGNLEELPDSTYLTSIRFNGCKGITGDIGNILRKFPNIGKNNGDFNIYQSAISGDAGDLGLLNYIPLSFYLSNYITGELYNAVVGWRSRISLNGHINSILSGGRLYLFSILLKKGDSFDLSWTADTVSITLGDVTTKFDNNGNIID